MKQLVCAECYYNRVVGDVLAERTYSLTDDSYLCVRCHPQSEPINLPPSPDEVETMRRKASQYDAILNPGEMIHRSTLLLVESDRDSLRTQLAEAVALLRDARGALTFYSSWMACHGTPCAKTICDCPTQPSNPHYPSGRRIEESARAFLARFDGKGGA